jgi:hypothetical protein
MLPQWQDRSNGVTDFGNLLIRLINRPWWAAFHLQARRRKPRLG